MGQILIRNLDDAALDALKRRAARHGVSTEEEARRTLTANLGLNLNEVLARLDALREMNGPQKDGSSLELLRADRDRDN